MTDQSSRRRSPISVVITSFNDGPLLGEALASVTAQGIDPLEVLVIDDGWAPATAPDVIEAVRSKYGLDVAYSWQENQGPSAARTVGIANPCGEFIAFLDADDRRLADHLELRPPPTYPVWDPSCATSRILECPLSALLFPPTTVPRR